MRDYAELVKAARSSARWIMAKATESSFAHDELKALHHADAVFEAADAIEELLARDVVPTDFHERCLQLEIKKRIELEKQLPQWISVEDALPKSESMVLVATKYGGVYYGFLNHSGKFYTANNTLYDSWCWEPDVTHWMPLPEPPKGVE